ncbi:Hypothetical protein A7982_05314 [Minicystis rosea]|nr:Hypothetical protein A7982_05314 [Minicystis rosea]
MKTFGIAAGALALAAATPAFAQNKQQTPQPNAPPQQPGADATIEETVPTPMTPQPNRPTVTTGEVARDVGGYMSAPVRAPRNALEIGVDAGYTQGFGNINRGRGVRDLAGAGGTIGASIGYRIDPRWSVAASGQFQGYGSTVTAPTGGANAVTVRGVTAGVQGTYHMQPHNRVDPYLTVGTGYRGLIESPTGNLPTMYTHGLELAKVEVGLDVRPTDSVAVSPVIGADLNMFMWRAGGGAETASLTNRSVNTFIFAGVKGRFDIGGTRERLPEQQVGRR